MRRREPGGASLRESGRDEGRPSSVREGAGGSLRRPLLLAIAAALSLSLWAAAALALPEKTWLVAVGNNLGAADEVELLFAERDAREVAEVLRTEGGVSTRRTTLLLGEDAATVRQELLRVNTEIRAQSARGGPATALLVFYSGHADATALHMEGTSLLGDELRALVESSPASVRLLIVDACRSGTVTRVKGVAAAPSFDLSLDAPGGAEGMAIITSSAAGESSQESDELRGSFFTHHFISALRGAADRNGDGQVTLGEAYGYTYSQTLRSSGRTLDLQHPTYHYDVKGRGELVISVPGGSSRGTGKLRLAEAGVYLVTERREGGPVVAEVAPGHDSALLALPANTYFVQQRMAREYREYTLTLRAGEQRALSDLPHRSVAYDRLVRRRGGRREAVQGIGVLAGGRGELLAGEGATGQLVLSWGLDLAELSLGVRLRGSRVQSAGADGDSPRAHEELGLGLVVQRFVDLRWFSASFGLLVEGAVHRQDFRSQREAPQRLSYGLAFGGLLSVERQLLGALALRIEGGPLSSVLSQASTELGVSSDAQVETPLTWWGAGGLVWRY